jgi:hypothetical protein
MFPTIYYITDHLVLRAAEKDAYSAIKDFTRSMEKKFGVRLFMLSAHVDPKGSVIFCQ